MAVMIAFVLENSAGKTALLSQFAYKHFKENYKATIGSGPLSDRKSHFPALFVPLA
jgi:GTPase SAR1 family protein